MKRLTLLALAAMALTSGAVANKIIVGCGPLDCVQTQIIVGCGPLDCVK